MEFPDQQNTETSGFCTDELGEKNDVQSKIHQHPPAFIAQDLKTTVSFYTEKLRFTSAEHFDKHAAFAPIYRDEIEIIVAKGKHGLVQENMASHGAGFDAHVDTETREHRWSGPCRRPEQVLCGSERHAFRALNATSCLLAVRGMACNLRPEGVDRNVFLCLFFQ